MKNYLLALGCSAVALTAFTSVASADFIITSTRTTTTIPASASVVGGSPGEAVDVIVFKIQNNGANGTGTKLDAIGLDVTTPGTTSATAMSFQTYDSLGNGTGLDINVNGINVSSPAINYGSALGTFIRFGTASGFGVLAANPPYQQDPAGTGSTTFDPTLGYTNLHDFNLQGGVNGGTADTAAINLASVVVPVGTPVTIAGTAGGDLGNLVPVSGTNGGVATPEPASLGVLALGGVALLARRKKA